MTRASGTSRFAPWFFLLPFIAIFGVFTLVPLLDAIRLAFRQTYGPGFSKPVGLDNFIHLASDPLFWTAAKNTVLFTAGSVFIQLPLSLLLAMVLNRPGIRGRAALRLVFFAPSLVGVVFVAMIFLMLLEKRTGLINVALHATIGLDLDFPWLETHIMPALILATLWQYVGFNMLYFLAALQNVSQELVEAATLDGAGPLGRFWNVTVPSIRPIATFVILLSIIGSFQLFELPFVLLQGSGGPSNRGLTIVMDLYQTGVETGDLGYASAIGWTMGLALIGFAVAQRILARGEVHA
jgi:ABC-type sugar transport system permease subunit